MKGISTVAIYLLFFFYFCKLLFIIFTFSALYHILIKLSSKKVILKKLEIFSIVYFDNKKYFYVNLMILERF